MNDNLASAVRLLSNPVKDREGHVTILLGTKVL